MLYFFGMKWGGISSKELDEAILLEEALFGEAPKGTLVRRAPALRDVSDKSVGLNPQHVPPSPSPSNVAQQLLQQQVLSCKWLHF